MMIRVVWNIIKSIFSLIFRISSPFKRLVCRRRRSSDSDMTVPVANHYDSTTIDMSQQVPDGPEMEMQSWDSWGGEDQSMAGNHNMNNYSNMAQQHGNNYNNMISQHGNNYRQRVPQQEPEPEPEIDFFQDLTPQFKKAPKIKVKKKEEFTVNKSAISSRLAVSSEVPIPGSELESWEDAGGSAWGDEVQEDLSWQAEAAIKEKRRLERQERTMEQQKKKQERDMKPSSRREGHLPAVKLS